MRLHRRASFFGAWLALAIVASVFAVGAFATRRDLAESGQTWPFGAFVNVEIEMLVFVALVGTAVVSRRRPEAHKRHLVLATISALGPACFRFRHFLALVPNPIVAFTLVADAVWLVVMARDWRVQKRVHRVYLWAGAAMLAVPQCDHEPRGVHGPEAFAAVRLPDDDTLITTGNGHSVLRVDVHGTIEWKLAQDELPGIRFAWVTTIDVLPNGHYVLGNCHAGPGQPVLV